VSQRDIIRLVEGAPTIAPLIVRRASDYEARPVRWLWPGRIARGKLTVLAGHPGLGKSQLALAIGAIVTSGGRWPVTGESAERGAVVILSAEDDPADTIRPRLEAAGADLDRCHIVEAAQNIGNDGRPQRRGFCLADDLTRLDTTLQEIGEVMLVIIDPITAYLGAVDSHRNAEVRAALAPVAELASQHATAVLAISHLRKSDTGDAVLRVIGSLAFAAAARAVYIVSGDPNDPARRLLLPAKNNIGEDRTGCAYRIEPATIGRGIETCRIAWGLEAVTITADQALAPCDRAGAAHGQRPAPERTAAQAWLADMLAAGPVAVATAARRGRGGRA
jgi:energy-coupling factor transporter ATP-binding protein EcfA2